MTIRTEPMTVNVGPQHPSTHGVFRVRITFDGEDIVEVEPVLGYCTGARRSWRRNATTCRW